MAGTRARRGLRIDELPGHEQLAVRRPAQVVRIEVDLDAGALALAGQRHPIDLFRSVSVDVEPLAVGRGGNAVVAGELRARDLTEPLAAWSPQVNDAVDLPGHDVLKGLLVAGVQELGDCKGPFGQMGDGVAAGACRQDRAADPLSRALGGMQMEHLYRFSTAMVDGPHGSHTMTLGNVQSVSGQTLQVGRGAAGVQRVGFGRDRQFHRFCGFSGGIDQIEADSASSGLVGASDQPASALDG